MDEKLGQIHTNRNNNTWPSPSTRVPHLLRAATGMVCSLNKRW
jgi:hypothetical protein